MVQGIHTHLPWVHKWKRLIQSIPGYRVTEMSKMLPLQKLDEEWGSCEIFWDSCACMWVCLGGKAADRITHSKWEEHHNEVPWHNDDIIGKPQDSPKCYKKMKWVARSTRTTQENGLRSLSNSFPHALQCTLWCIKLVLPEMVDKWKHMWLYSAHLHMKWSAAAMHSAMWGTPP